MTNSEQRLANLEAIAIQAARQIREANQLLESLTPEEQLTHKEGLAEMDKNIRAVYELLNETVPVVLRNELGRIGELLHHQEKNPELN